MRVHLCHIYDFHDNRLSSVRVFIDYNERRGKQWLFSELTGLVGWKRKA